MNDKDIEVKGAFDAFDSKKGKTSKEKIKAKDIRGFHNIYMNNEDRIIFDNCYDAMYDIWKKGGKQGDKPFKYTPFQEAAAYLKEKYKL